MFLMGKACTFKREGRGRGSVIPCYTWVMSEVIIAEPSNG